MKMTEKDAWELIDNPKAIEQSLEEGVELTKKTLEMVAKMHVIFSKIMKDGKKGFAHAYEMSDKIFLDRLLLDFLEVAKHNRKIPADKVLNAINEVSDKTRIFVAMNECNIIMAEAMKHWISDYELSSMTLIRRLSNGIEPSEEVLSDEKALGQFLFECYLSRLEEAKLSWKEKIEA